MTWFDASTNAQTSPRRGRRPRARTRISKPSPIAGAIDRPLAVTTHPVSARAAPRISRARTAGSSSGLAPLTAPAPLAVGGSCLPSRPVIEIAGHRFDVDVDDPVDRRHLAAFFGPSTPMDDARGPTVSIRVGELAGPTDPADSRNGPLERWDDGGSIRLRHVDGNRGALVDGDTIVVGPASTTDGDRWRTTRQLLTEALSAWLARHHELLLHGAIIAHDDVALVVLGPTGAGKSTAVVAALGRGLEVATDDLAVVRVDSEREAALLCDGISKPLMVERSLAARLGAGDASAIDARDRVPLGVEWLRPATRRLRGVVEITHSLDAARIEPLDHAATLAVVGASSFEVAHGGIGFVLPTLARVAGLPAWRLAHDREPDMRLDAAGRFLEEILDRVAVD